MSALPVISVVVPSYNQGHFLAEALESIFRQEYPRLEVVVMDGGSTDSSLQVIRSYADRLKYWQSQKDGGQSLAINAGVAHCTGQLVAWLNSDDFYSPGALWTVADAYRAYPNHGLYVANGLRYEQATGKYHPFCTRHMGFDRQALVWGTDTILQPSTFFLREAWQNVGGLKPNLSFCMDWDIFIRIAQRYPAVILNEFLGVSREYEETKTRSGKMTRAAEIVCMIQAHTDTELTPGTMLYLVDTLIDITSTWPGQPLTSSTQARFRKPLLKVMDALCRHVQTTYGGGIHGFPEHTDPQDKLYLPFAKPERGLPRGESLRPGSTSISIVIPSPGRWDHLQKTLDSIRNQHYERVETVLVDEPCQVREEYKTVGKPAGGSRPGQLINHGLRQATGEVLGWLEAGDLLAAGALEEVARAFAQDPDLDLVYGNAIHIDDGEQFVLADHGPFASGLWVGDTPKPGEWATYGEDVLCVPPGAVFFRRRVLEKCGFLSEKVRYSLAYEWFTRLAGRIKMAKLQRTQAFYRVHQKVERYPWNRMLIEAYGISRRLWPTPFAASHPAFFREFLRKYMNRKFLRAPRRVYFWGAACFVGLCAVTRILNPERLWSWRLPRDHVRKLRRAGQLPERTRTIKAA